MREKEKFKIDVVIPWVDGNDPVWQKEKNAYLGNTQIIEANGASRYRDWDTLKYWFRSIEKNANWINKIHFVTYGHLPNWLDTTYKKINIVRHEDFIPKEYLPTFSSIAIELNIHRIADLEDHFIYMNDDTFIMNPIHESFYFNSKGLPCQMLKIMCLDNYDPDSDFCITNFNNMGVLNRNFRIQEIPKTKVINCNYDLKTNIRNLALFLSYIYPGFCQFHMPAPFLKSTFIDVWAKEEEYLNKTCTHKFRHYKDVNQWLMQYWQLVQGKFYPINIEKDVKMFEIGRDNEKMYRALQEQKYKIVCLNDSDTNIDFHNEKEKLCLFLEKMYPNKSNFEK